MAKRGRERAAERSKGRNRRDRRPAVPGASGTDTPGRQDGAASSAAASARVGTDPVEVLWARTRSGARSGRGYHYQDVVGAWLCGRLLTAQLKADKIVPEGPEDLSCEGQAGWQVQVKSRQERVGDFSVSEVARHLLDLAARHAERQAAGITGRPVLVLERAVAGETFTQWGATVDELPRDHPLRRALTDGGLRRGLTEKQVAEVAKLISVCVLPWRAAAEQTRAAVADQHRLLPAAAEPVVLALRDVVAECADANAQTGWTTRAGLDRTRVASVAQETIALLDLASLEQALSSGLCEPVDFDTPLHTEAFYEGVEVQPGHIAAGLPAPRPAVTGDVVAALEQARPVLVTGPSGVGKSTVMWAAAYASRHVLWYRVQRLRPGDVEPLVRLARASHGTRRSPVGFVVDGVGAGNAQAWDDLHQALAPLTGVVLLASARTEDLLPLRTLAGCTTVQVRLDEEVAAQIHAGLLRQGATTTPHWLAAFRDSEGLTLEYTHVLTRGRRLSAVLTEQVDRRVTERRDAELQILALVATAHRWGTALPLHRVQAALGLTDADMRVAIARLNDEHLVHEKDSHLTGLHRLRSAALSVAVHRRPPPGLHETVDAVLALLGDNDSQPFVAGVLLDVPDLDGNVLERLTADIRRDPNAARLTTVLQALRLVDMHRLAENWARVLDRHGVQPAYRSIALQLTLLDSELGDGLTAAMRPEIVAAAAEIAPETGTAAALRDLLLDRLEPTLAASSLAACDDAGTALRLLGVLAGAAPDIASQIASQIDAWDDYVAFITVLREADAEQLGDLVITAHAVSPELAQVLLGLAGGVPSVRARLQTQSPWVTAVNVLEQDGQAVAFARLLHVSDRAEPDIDGATRAVARTLMRCLPHCQSADVQALFPGDVPLQIGDHIAAVSQLQRRYVHGPAATAWNRLRSQVALSACGTTDAASRASVAHDLVVGTARYAATLAQVWCLSRRREADAARLEQQRRSLRAAADELLLPINRADLFRTGAVDDPPDLVNDHLHTLVQGIVDRLSSGLQSASGGNAPLTAYVLGLRRTLAQVQESEDWELAGSVCPDEIDQLDRTLIDLHALLAEFTWGDLRPAAVVAAARAGSYDQALHRVAELARSRAQHRAQETARLTKTGAQAIGLNVEVWTRPAAGPHAVDWPPVETAIGIRVTTLAECEPTTHGLVNLLEQQRSDAGRPSVLLVPLVQDRPVRALARAVVMQAWPGQDLYDAWDDQLDPAWPTPLTDAALGVHQALQALSGLSVLARLRSETSSLQEYADGETDRFHAARRNIEGMAPDNAVVTEVLAHLDDLAVRVQEEHDAGGPVEETLAAGVAQGAVRGGTADYSKLEALLAVCIQWDIDPDEAACLLN